jgi:hypothetical protein
MYIQVLQGAQLCTTRVHNCTTRVHTCTTGVHTSTIWCTYNYYKCTSVYYSVYKYVLQDAQVCTTGLHTSTTGLHTSTIGCTSVYYRLSNCVLQVYIQVIQVQMHIRKKKSFFLCGDICGIRWCPLQKKNSSKTVWFLVKVGGSTPIRSFNKTFFVLC